VKRRRGEWTLGERALYRVFRYFAGWIGCLPLPLSAAVGRSIGRIAWPFARGRRRIAIDNLNFVCGRSLSARRKERIAFESFVRLFQDAFFLVTAAQHPTREGRLLLRLVNDDYLRDRIAQGKGAILVGGHLSNFYVMLGLMGRLRFKVAVLVRPFGFRPAQRVLEELSMAAGLTMLDQGKSALWITRHLADGGITWFTVDQNVRHGFPVDFFGRPATTFTGPVRLARKLDVPMIPAFVHQVGPFAYEMEFRDPIHLPATPPSDAEVRADLAQLMAMLEEEIRRYPESWLWAHRRWRHGELLGGNAPPK
jgi:Kdo2-lipid IVA lauroyltransferase/acyltransferase